MFFLLISTVPPSMQRKLTENGECCMQNNQLPTNSHGEVEDNYNSFQLARYLQKAACLD